jgi:type III restriction enzyme
MVVTVGAINKKDVNNLYKDSEKTGGEKPIDLIRATRPIVIVDEPQSVDGGLEGRGKEALDAMNPLCTLRYSATHVDKHHMVYRLDAVDAYERKLVKQIEVASADHRGRHNKAYVRLLEVRSKKRHRRPSWSWTCSKAARWCQGVWCRTATTWSNTPAAALRRLPVGEIQAAKGEELRGAAHAGGEQWLQPWAGHRRHRRRWPSSAR